MDRPKVRQAWTSKMAELLEARQDFEEIIQHEVERLPAAKRREERRDPRDPRTDALVCVSLRQMDQQEQQDGNFTVVAARSPYVVTFEPSFNFKNQARIHPQRFPADIVYGPEEEAGEMFLTCGGPLVDIAMAGGVGLLVSTGQTGCGKTALYQEMLTLCASAVLERSRGGRKACFVSFIEVLGSCVTDLMSTNSNLDVREDREGRVRGAEAIENKITTLDQFSKLFSKVTRAERRTPKDRARCHLVCRLRLKDMGGDLGPVSRCSSMASLATVTGGSRGEEEEAEEEGLLYMVELAGFEQVEMCENKREAQTLTRSMATLKDCIRGRAMTVTNPDQVYPIPYKQTPLTLMLKDVFCIESMRQTRVVLLGSLSPCVEDLSPSVHTLRWLGAVKTANRELRSVSHDEENPVNWAREEVDSWLQMDWPHLTPRNPVSSLSGWQLLRLTRSQFLKFCQGQVDREDATQIHSQFWQLYLKARVAVAERGEHSKEKFQIKEPVRKSYTEIMNGDEEEEDKINVALGTSKKRFEEKLNEGFKPNMPRYHRKNEDMMKMEWANKVAASDRAEAKLYPILSIDTSGGDNTPKKGRSRRNSIYD